MELVEIEGDALFFYTHSSHSMSRVESQIEAMLRAFHNHIAKYENLRICNCGACMAAIKLKLKFILHVGPLHFIRVSGREKPFGHHVNLTHRLLKNEVPFDQYFLLSEDAWNHFMPSDPLSFAKSTTALDLGEVTYYFKKLPTPPVSREIEPPEQDGFFEKGKKPDLKVTRTIEAAQDILFEYVSNLQKRTEWDRVPKKLKFDPERINRKGMEHNCIVGSRTLRFQTGKSTSNEGAAKIYTEYTGDVPLLKRYQYYILLRPLSTKQTLVNILIYFEADLVGKLAWNTFLKKRLRRNWSHKLEQLDRLLS